MTGPEERKDRKPYPTTSIETPIATILNQDSTERQDPHHKLFIFLLPWCCLGALFKFVFLYLLLQKSVEAIQKCNPMVKVSTGKWPMYRESRDVWEKFMYWDGCSGGDEGS